MTRRTTWYLGMALATLIGLGATSAHGSLVLDLRTATGGTSIVVTPAMIGTDISLKVWANVTGTGAAAEGLWYVYYSVKSNNTGGGAITGGLTGGTLVSPFAASGSQVGTVAELNSPSDNLTDMGTNNATPVAAHAKPRAAEATYSNSSPLYGEAITDGWRWNVESVTLHITSAILGSGSSAYSAIPPSIMTGVTKAGLWYEDMTLRQVAYSTGTGVTLTLEATVVDASVEEEEYTIYQGAPEEVAGSAMITAGFGSILSTGWDFDCDGTQDMAGNVASVSYEYLKLLGYVDNVPHLAWFKGFSNDGKSDMDTTMITILPEPATLALLGLGGLALVLRRRRTR